MIQAAFGGTPFSSEVDLWLEVEGYPPGNIALSQAGADFVVVTEPIDLPAGPAWVVVSVDGHLYRNRVHLTRGISQDHSRVPTAACCENDLPF